MNFKVPRHQYAVVVLDSRPDRAEPTVALLKGAGYDPRFFADSASLLATVMGQPPHMILVHRGDEVNQIGQMLTDLRDRLPESHFVVLSSAAGLASTWREWGELIYDCVLTPPVHPQQLIQSIDRAAERDAIMYRAEDLAEKVSGFEAKDAEAREVEPPAVTQISNLVLVEPPDLRNSLAELQEETEQFVAAVMNEVQYSGPVDQNSETVISEVKSIDSDHDFWPCWTRFAQQGRVEEVIRELVALANEISDGAPSVFLRYLPNRRVLVASAGQGLAAEAWKSLGLDLSQEPDFRIGDLRHPEKLPGLKEMAQAVGSPQGLWVRPVVLRDEVHGLVAIFKDPSSLPTAEAEAVLRLAESRAQFLDLNHYLHTIEILDAGTGLINRAACHSRLTGEVTRARRLMLPVSLLIISLDQHRELVAQYGIEELQTALRALGKILSPRIRVNDILARWSSEDLALVLPHTSSQGAAIKAERIRRLIGTADFSKLLPRFPQLTVSVGVSEYPSCCRDVDDLFSTADDALWQVKEKIGNKVCVATPVAGFVPDFLVRGE